MWTDHVEKTDAHNLPRSVLRPCPIKWCCRMCMPECARGVGVRTCTHAHVHACVVCGVCVCACVVGVCRIHADSGTHANGREAMLMPGPMPTAEPCAWRRSCRAGPMAGPCRWRGHADGRPIPMAGLCRWRGRWHDGAVRTAGSCRCRGHADCNAGPCRRRGHADGGWRGHADGIGAIPTSKAMPMSGPWRWQVCIYTSVHMSVHTSIHVSGHILA